MKPCNDICAVMSDSGMEDVPLEDTSMCSSEKGKDPQEDSNVSPSPKSTEQTSENKENHEISGGIFFHVVCSLVFFSHWMDFDL